MANLRLLFNKYNNKTIFLSNKLIRNALKNKDL